MFVPESVGPQLGHAFSLGLYTFARHYSGLTFPLTPPSASFTVHALTCLGIFAFDLFLPHFQPLRQQATAYLPVVHLCILALESFIALAASEVEELVQLSLHPLFLDVQVSSALADLSTYTTLECLSVLHLSIARHNPLLLLHQITYTPLSQSKVLCAFLNEVSPSVSVLPHCSCFQPLLSCSLSGFCSSKAGFSSFSPRFSSPF